VCPTRVCRFVAIASDVPTPRIRDGIRAALPLAPSPVLFGLSFGVFAETAGLNAVAAIVMSATTFAGSAQFAAITVIHDGGTAAAAIVAALLLNARYVGMSIAVSSIFPGSRPRRLAESQLIVDESWALSGRSGRFQWPILIGAGLVLYVLWVSSTAIGAILGSTLANPSSLGLDAAFAALFLALAVPYIRGRTAVAASALSAVITLVLLPVAPPGVPFVAAASACLLGLRK